MAFAGRTTYASRYSSYCHWSPSYAFAGIYTNTFFLPTQGELETRLLAFSRPQLEPRPQAPNPSNFSAFVVRPGLVLAKPPGILNSIMGLSKAYTIRVDDLAAAMADIAIEGKGDRIVENGGLRARVLGDGKE